jgi:hypothetical protein
MLGYFGLLLLRYNMKFIIILFTILILSSCTFKQSEIKLNQYHVKFLFEIEGKRIFRFYDFEKNHYFIIDSKNGGAEIK